MSKIYTLMRKSFLLTAALLMWAVGTKTYAQNPTITYTVDNKAAVSSVTPDPFSGTYSQTYTGASGQITNTNSSTLTLSDFDENTIEKITLSMHTNTSKGAGSIAVNIDGTEVYNEEYAGGKGLDWRDVVITPTATWSGSDVEIVISCTTNSLYIASYTIEYSTSGTDTREAAGIGFDVTTFNAVLEDQATTNFPELNDPNGVADFTWTSSDPSVATVDASTGAITMLTPGSTTITATFTGDSDYLPATASYELVITSSAPKSAGSITYTIDSKTSVSSNPSYDPFAAEFSTTYGGAAGQMTAGNKVVLTINNFEGYEIESLVLSMKTNKSTGAGTITVAADGTEVYSEEYGNLSVVSNEYHDVTLTGASTWSGDVITVTVEATENSLYVESYTVNYKPFGSGEREEAELSFDEESFEAAIEAGAGVSYPEVNNPNGVDPLVWSSSDETVATIDATTGAITLLKVGQTTITVSFAGDSDYKPGEASYLLNVVSNDPDAAKVVTYTVTSKEAVSCSLTPDPFSATYTQDYTTAMQLTAGKTATLTLSDFDDLEIDRIVLSMHTNASKGAGNIKVTVGSETYYDEAYAAGYGTNWRDVEFTGVEGLRGSEVTISINATVNSLFIQSFTIYYKEASGASKESAALSFEKEEIYIPITEPYATDANELNNPNNLSPITWSSSDESVATVDNDGYVTVVSTGTAIISASYAGDDNYLAGTAKYTLQAWDGITYEKIEDASTLEPGMTITLYDEVLGVALSTTQNTNNRPAVNVTDDEGKFNVVSPNVQPILLGGTAGAWTLSPEEGKYFYCTGKDNMLKTANKDTATVNIILGAGGKATIYFTNVTGRVYLYCNANSGTPIFACYNQRVDTTPDPEAVRLDPIRVKAASDYHDLSLYKKDVPIVSGIDTPTADAKDNNLIYDLRGRRITGKLTPGLYIRGGKKILIPNGN